MDEPLCAMCTLRNCPSCPNLTRIKIGGGGVEGAGRRDIGSWT
ncbi:MAG: hypothetical protein ABIF18_03185 [archaeon]